jgi:hypothetical protein
MIFSEGEELFQHHLANWKKPTERPYDCSCAFCRLKRDSDELKVKSETLSDWFKKEAQIIDDEYRKKIDLLKEKFAAKQRECIHTFEDHLDRFWVLDGTVLEQICTKCGLKRYTSEFEEQK